MEDGKEELCGQLHTLDTTLMFLFLIVLSVLLSFAATVRQREALCLTLQGEEACARQVGDVHPMRLAASALIVGSVGYFFQLAQENCAEADPRDGSGARSAARNLIAAFLVLLAALIRLFDLNAAAPADQLE